MTSQIYYPPSENGPLSWNWVTLEGPDAQDFLQRLTTVHLRQLAVGQGVPGCFLTAQGKIRSYFQLWNPKKDHYAFEFDAGNSGKWKTDLLAIIDQYTFGEKFTLEDRTPNLKCVWIFPDKDLISRLGLELSRGSTVGQIILIEEGSNPPLQICNHGTQSYGKTWITVWGQAQALDAWITQNVPQGNEPVLSFQTLESWRIQAVQPRVDAEITETALPLEIGLRSAIADNKGCYPGQEVIEKIVALGSPAKRLVKIEGTGMPPQTGERVLAFDANTQQVGSEIGAVTTSLASQQGFLALALIRKTHAQAGTKIKFLNQPESSGTVVQIAAHT